MKDQEEPRGADEATEKCMLYEPFDVYACYAYQRDEAPGRYRNKRRKQHALDRAYDSVVNAVTQLRANAADGDRVAMGHVLQILSDLVCWIEYQELRQPTLLQSFARKWSCWPMRAAPHPFLMQRLRSQLLTFGVGTESTVKTGTGTRWGTRKRRNEKSGGRSTAALHAEVMVGTIGYNKDFWLSGVKAVVKKNPRVRKEWQEVPYTIQHGSKSERPPPLNTPLSAFNSLVLSTMGLMVCGLDHRWARHQTNPIVRLG